MLYNKSDGLQSNQFNFRSSIKTSNGKMYFGGINGFNAFGDAGTVCNFFSFARK